MSISITRILTTSAFGFMLVMAIACAATGCLTVEDHDCGGGNTTVIVLEPGDSPDAGVPDGQAPPDGQADPTGPTVPMAAPTVSLAPLPTTNLSNGTQVLYRATVTADAAADVHLKKMSFLVIVTNGYAPGVDLYDAQLRVVGTASNLPSASRVDETGGSDCGFASSASSRCVSIVLDSPLTVAAGTSSTLELRLDVAATWSQGDSLATETVMDPDNEQQGPLAGTGLGTVIKNHAEDDFLWSNDGAWYYDGHDVVATPAAQVLTR